MGPARRECLDHLLVVGRRHLECVLREFVEHYRRSGHTRDWGGGCRVESPPAPVPAGWMARRDRPGGLGSTNTNERHHDPTPVFLTPHLGRPPFSCPGWPSPWVPRPAQRSPTGIALTTKAFACSPAGCTNAFLRPILEFATNVSLGTGRRSVLGRGHRETARLGSDRPA